MPEVSTVLSLPLILPSQAQKHVTHNEALRVLDVAVQLAVLNRNLTAAPALPAIGDRHIIGAGPTGVWAGKSGQVAVFTAQGWDYFVAKPGWQAHILAEAQTAVFDGTDWAVPGAGPLAPSMLGVNTSADVTNRLAVSSNATLLTHDGGGHQLKVNKSATAQTASLLFQSAFSGRAEMGLMGSNDFSIKVSADGASFADAMVVDRVTGVVGLPQGVASDGFALRDAVDLTKAGVFSLSGLTAGATRSYALPDTSSELAILAGTQTFTGAKTFAGTLTASGTLAVPGVLSVSGALATLGSATGAATYGVGTGATTTGVTKTVNIGTGGASGSTTVVNIGSATAGAGGSLVVNAPTVTFANSVTTVDMAQAELSALRLGLGGAVADATNRLAINTPAALFNHAGAGVELTLNKAAPGDDAAIAFKTGLSTRATMGLLGNDGLKLRVSPDGTSYFNALSADQATGQVTLNQPLVLEGQVADPMGAADGTVWHNVTTGQIRAQVNGAVRTIDSQQDIPFLKPIAGEYILSNIGAGGATTTTLAGAAGRMDIFPYNPRADVTVDMLTVNVTTLVAGALGKIVVYEADGNGRPSDLIAETGTLDFATVGLKSTAVTLTLRQGKTYWFGIRHSATATLSTWVVGATPDLGCGAPLTAARKTLRRVLAFATPAPTTWGYLSSESSTGLATAIWLRMG